MSETGDRACDTCKPGTGMVTERTPRVLVIDDEEINLRVLEKMLTKAGYAAFTARDGATGRRVAVSACPDIILLDIMMPGENGFRTLELLQQDRRTMDIPIIFISALSDVDHKVRGLEGGAVDYVTKPFDRSEVLARIRLHLRLVQARQLLIRTQAERLNQLASAQQAILTSPEDVPEARFGVIYKPADKAGGDFYDVFPSEGDIHSYFMADICGHDLGASFVTSSLKALLTHNSGPLYSPTEMLKNINAVLRTILADGKFLTAQLLRVDRRNSEIQLFNAGHPYAVHVPVGGRPVYLNVSGDILGVFPAVYLTPMRYVVNKGDMIYMYTDGLVERFNLDGTFDRRLDEELLEICGRCADLSPGEAVERVFMGLIKDQHQLQDDMVVMAIKI